MDERAVSAVWFHQNVYGQPVPIAAQACEEIELEAECYYLTATFACVNILSKAKVN